MNTGENARKMAKRARDWWFFMGKEKNKIKNKNKNWVHLCLLCDSLDTVAVTSLLPFVFGYRELSSPKHRGSLLSFWHRATVKIACLDIGHYQTKASICQNQSRTIANCQGNYDSKVLVSVGQVGGPKWSSRLRKHVLGPARRYRYKCGYYSSQVQTAYLPTVPGQLGDYAIYKILPLPQLHLQNAIEGIYCIVLVLHRQLNHL